MMKKRTPKLYNIFPPHRGARVRFMLFITFFFFIYIETDQWFDIFVYSQGYSYRQERNC